MNAASQLSTSYLTSYPQEAALVLQQFPIQEATQFLNQQSASDISSVLANTIPFLAARYLSGMDVSRAVEAISSLSSEQAVPYLRHMEEDCREKLLDALPQSLGETYRQLLRWPVGAAGSMMNPFLLVLTEEMSVSQAMKHARSGQKAAFYYPYIVDSKQKLVGILSLRKLMQAELKQSLGEIMERKVTRILGSTSIDTLIRTMDWQTFESIPVVDEKNVLLGAIRRDTIKSAASHSAPSQSKPTLVDGLLSLSEFYGQTAIELMPLIAQAAIGLTKRTENKGKNV